MEPTKKKEFQGKAPDLMRDYKFFAGTFGVCSIHFPEFGRET
jgi:hypothetical protein